MRTQVPIKLDIVKSVSESGPESGSWSTRKQRAYRTALTHESGFKTLGKSASKKEISPARPSGPPTTLYLCQYLHQYLVGICSVSDKSADFGDIRCLRVGRPVGAGRWESQRKFSAGDGIVTKPV